MFILLDSTEPFRDGQDSPPFDFPTGLRTSSSVRSAPQSFTEKKFPLDLSRAAGSGSRVKHRPESGVLVFPGPDLRAPEPHCSAAARRPSSGPWRPQGRPDPAARTSSWLEGPPRQGVVLLKVNGQDREEESQAVPQGPWSGRGAPPPPSLPTSEAPAPSPPSLHQRRPGGGATEARPSSISSS